MTPAPVVLSEDLIAVILSFLPVKPLLRFRCVSKSWKTLISDSIFVKLHLEKSQTRNSSLFTIITSHENRIPGNDNEYEEEYNVVRSPIDRIFENRSFTVVDDPNYHHLNNKGSRIGSSIVGSCNGLLLLRTYKYGDLYENLEYWLRVWNPATGTTSEKFGYFRHREAFHFAFGCDNSTGTYKVVAFYDRLTTPEVRVINLGGGDHVWRNIQNFPAAPFHLSMGHKHAYLSGTLNWLAIHNNKFLYNCKDITVEQFTIVSLDLGTETYNQYTVPRGFDEVPFNAPTIGVLGGCLCFSYSYRETDFVIWQMKKFGVEDSWTQLLKISYHDILLIDYNFREDETMFYFKLVPLFLSEDGDTLILESILESEIILYNTKDNRAKRTKIIASSDHVYWNYASDYVESLVPIF